MVNAMELLQNWRNADQMNALRAAADQREAAMQPYQIEAAKLNMLAKRQALQQDEMRRNALQQYGATGNINALAMGDPEMAAKLRMMQDRNMLRPGAMGGTRGTGAGGGAGGMPKPSWDAARGVWLLPPTPENPQGKVIQPQGLPQVTKEKEEKPLTEAQGNATGFGLRAAKAYDILDSLEESGTYGRMANVVSGTREALNRVPVVGTAAANIAGAIGNTALTGPQQQYQQAKEDFVRAVLRKESGATITDDEMAGADRQYFPSAGDNEKTIKQKRDNRLTAIQSLKIQAGPGAKNVPNTRKRATEVPQGVDPKIWEAMTPEERKLWQ